MKPPDPLLRIQILRNNTKLLINKTKLEEVTENRHSLITMWLDYQKPLDSVPHKWLIKVLKLTKVPEKIITVIKTSIKTWSAIVSGGTSIESQLIQYLRRIYAESTQNLRRIFQGGSLSALRFIFCVNPLSYLLNKLQGYHIGKNGNRNQNISRLFFVDNLKLFATNMNQMKLLLDQVTQFSNNVGMKFGQSKCSW